MTKENHYADSHPERKPNGVPRHKPGKKGRNREASYKQDDPDSHNDICKHKDPDPDDPGNPEEAQTPDCHTHRRQNKYQKMYHHPECVKGPTDFHYYKIPNACCHLRPRCVCREGYRLHRDYRSLPARRRRIPDNACNVGRVYSQDYSYIFWIQLYRSIHHQHQTLLTVNYGGKPHTRNVNRRCCARNTPVPTLIFAYNSRKPLPTTQEPEEYGTVNFPMSYIHNFQSGLCPAGLFRRVSSEKHRQNHPHRTHQSGSAHRSFSTARLLPYICQAELP